MKRYLILVLFLVSIQVKSQFAIINDKDGYTNVRDEKNINSKVIGRLFNDDVYLYDGNDLNSTDEWVHIFYSANLKEIESYKRDYYNKEKQCRKENEVYFDGYIHKSRFLPLEELNKVNSQILNPINGELNFNNDSISFQIKTGKFIENEHKIEGDKQNNIENYKIDGTHPYGTFLSKPRIEIKNLKLIINSKQIEIPKETYKDIFEPNLKVLDLYLDKQGVLYIYMPNNSDGAGGYSIVWIINNNKYLKRYVDSIG